MSKELLKNRMLNCSEFLKRYNALPNCFIDNFFTNNLFNLIPDDAQNVLLKLNDTALAKLATDQPEVIPRISAENSLAAFIENCSSLRIESLLSDTGFIKNLETVTFLPGVSIKNLPLKKRHEVERMCGFVASYAEILKLRKVVDIGSGGGYFGTVLSSFYGINVVGLESNWWIARRSAPRKIELVSESPFRKTLLCSEEKYHEKRCVWLHWQALRSQSTTPNSNVGRFSIKTTNFMRSDSNLEDLLNLREPLAVAGLHTCGSLASNVIHCFHKSKRARFLCVVPCCYSRSNEMFSTSPYFYKNEQVSKMFGFPMSSVFREASMQLGYQAKRLALTPVEKLYSVKDHCSVIGFPEAAERSFRLWVAIMVKMVSDLCDIRHTTDFVKIISPALADSSNFREFVLAACNLLSKSSVDVQFIKEMPEVIEDYWNIYAAEYPKFKAYACYANVLAPVLEAAYILDLLYFTIEAGDCEAFIVPIFDAAISPRRYAIVAIK